MNSELTAPKRRDYDQALRKYNECLTDGDFTSERFTATYQALLAAEKALAGVLLRRQGVR